MFCWTLNPGPQETKREKEKQNRNQIYLFCWTLNSGFDLDL